MKACPWVPEGIHRALHPETPTTQLLVHGTQCPHLPLWRSQPDLEAACTPGMLRVGRQRWTQPLCMLCGAPRCGRREIAALPPSLICEDGNFRWLSLCPFPLQPAQQLAHCGAEAACRGGVGLQGGLAVGGLVTRGEKGALVSLPGVQGHTDTSWGGTLLSKCHQSPWNRKGWFLSRRHLWWRQTAGRLTGCLTLLGTRARDSTTSSSMKGACRKPAACCQHSHGHDCCSASAAPSQRGPGLSAEPHRAARGKTPLHQHHA